MEIARLLAEIEVKKRENLELKRQVDLADVLAQNHKYVYI